MHKIKHFKETEFACKCGCGSKSMDAETLTMLDVAREEAGIPFVINSGRRCEAHNRAVGGSPTSSHMKGVAVDIRAKSSTARYRIVTALLKAGFTRIGVYKTFVHADNDKTKSKGVMWYG